MVEDGFGTTGGRKIGLSWINSQRLYKPSKQKFLMVAYMKCVSWNFEFTKALDPAERIDILEIKHDLRNVVLVQGMEDEVVGDSSAKSFYIKFAETELDWEYYKVVHIRFFHQRFSS